MRGTDRHGNYDLEPPVRFDGDPVALAFHAHAMRRYGAQALWQIFRRPTPSHIALLARLAVRPDVLRALLPRRRPGPT